MANKFDHLTATERGSAPTTPDTSDWRLYFKSDGLYVVDDAGTETGPLSDGGGATWAQVVDESGSTFTNWTSIAGTWSSNGTIISDTNTGAAHHGAYYNSPITMPNLCVAQADIRLPSSGQNAGDIWAGIALMSTSLSNAHGPRVLLSRQSGSFDYIDTYDGTTNRVAQLAGNGLSLDTWYTLRIVVIGVVVSVWLDGTYKYSATALDASDATALRNRVDRLVLVNYQAKVDYRNVKVWTQAGSLPA